MADHVDDNTGVRLSALESRVDAEAESVKEHFLEQQQFISFSLNRQSEKLRAEWREDVGAAMRRVDERFISVEQRLDNVAQRLGAIEQKVDAHHQANQLALSEILRRLPSAPG